ncbi:hypothetical protein [Yinghuangia seranimata]|uniref:hypothetical protein n=1 Tax=Yinghuangia seranimata TaxID=408067 RepID=UPI00248CF340|nr:hypothetical protein [Yinghuangia seranimata]MDI2130681.1 hypothetical protein [Yinghuangia seranimata]
MYRRTAALAALPVAAVLALAGCSDDNKSGGTTSAPPSPTTGFAATCNYLQQLKTDLGALKTARKDNPADSQAVKDAKAKVDADFQNVTNSVSGAKQNVVDALKSAYDGLQTALNNLPSGLPTGISSVIEVQITALEQAVTAASTQFACK